MSHLLRGVLIGLGISIGIGVLVALMRNDEMRRQLRVRYEGLRNSLLDSEQLNQTGQQVAGRVSRAAGQLKESAQQAVTKVRETASALNASMLNLWNIEPRKRTNCRYQADVDNPYSTTLLWKHISDRTRKAAMEAQQTGQDIASSIDQAAQSMQQDE